MRLKYLWPEVLAIMLKKVAIFVIGLFFVLSSIPGMAAEQWVVIKDSQGKCSVRKAKGTTPKTIAGPFATKAEAEKAKKEKCPKPEKKK